MPLRYRCRICGYIYNPSKGDPKEGIAPGTPFEKLPQNYRCPECHAYAFAGGRKPFDVLED
jgi:rubredoxin